MSTKSRTQTTNVSEPRPCRQINLTEKLGGVAYGGDYNPEQWPEKIWPEDMRLMREAGVNLVSIGIFSWAKLEPKPGVYDFGWLDRLVALLDKHDIHFLLANSTASTPPWFAKKYPQSLPVTADGVRLGLGSRQHYCPNSADYLRHTARLTKMFAKRYAKHPKLVAWHINNEIGCHITECHCDICAQEFRRWLRSKYGSLDKLNFAWGTAFWSQRYSDWEEIHTPRRAPTILNPTQQLDYRRFMSDSLMGVMTNEISAVRSVDPDAIVTTNSLPQHTPCDYFKWHEHLDLAGWDSYPDPAEGMKAVVNAALSHDMCRCFGKGKPFLLMEQTPSQVNWRKTNVLKAPGQMRALSYQAVSRGADAVMFFQWRASKAGAEKYHGSMVPHFGTDNSRVFNECKQLGSELKKLGPIAGSTIQARVAILMSWDILWAISLDSKPATFNNVDYFDLMLAYYEPLQRRGIAVDVVPPSAPLDNYDFVIAPTAYLLAKSDAENLTRFVARGGRLLATWMTGIVDQNEHIVLGGYPGYLREVLGLRVEEMQPLMPGEQRSVVEKATGKKSACSRWADLIQVDQAEVLATFGGDWYAGRSALTKNNFGQGEAYYLATQPAADFIDWLVGKLAEQCGLRGPVEVSAGVEVSVRRNTAAEFIFIINHNAKPAKADFGKLAGVDLLTGKPCTGKLNLEPFGVRIVLRKIK